MMTAAAPKGNRAKKGLMAQELEPQKTAAGGKMSSHGGRASDGSRPADDTGRRPEVLAGVDAMINMQRGEIRDPFLAGVAHDGDGVSSICFQRQSCVVPPVLK